VRFAECGRQSGCCVRPGLVFDDTRALSFALLLVDAGFAEYGLTESQQELMYHKDKIWKLTMQPAAATALLCPIAS
jgi:hypothetical protein